MCAPSTLFWQRTHFKISVYEYFENHHFRINALVVFFSVSILINHIRPEANYGTYDLSETYHGKVGDDGSHFSLTGGCGNSWKSYRNYPWKVWLGIG